MISGIKQINARKKEGQTIQRHREHQDTQSRDTGNIGTHNPETQGTLGHTIQRHREHQDTQFRDTGNIRTHNSETQGTLGHTIQRHREHQDTQFRDTGTLGHTIQRHREHQDTKHRTEKNKQKNTTQKTKKKINMDLTIHVFVIVDGVQFLLRKLNICIWYKGVGIHFPLNNFE